MARRRSFFVPRAVFGVSFGGVVPACVALGIQACNSGGPVLGVAAVAYCCFEASVPEGGDASEASTDAENDSATDSATDAPDDGSNDGSNDGATE
jgi:hypothetical protein